MIVGAETGEAVIGSVAAVEAAMAAEVAETSMTEASSAVVTAAAVVTTVAAAAAVAAVQADNSYFPCLGGDSLELTGLLLLKCFKVAVHFFESRNLCVEEIVESLFVFFEAAIQHPKKVCDLHFPRPRFVLGRRALFSKDCLTFRAT